MRVRVKSSRVLLHGNTEDSLNDVIEEYFSNTVSQLNSICRLHLLLVGGVQSENPHEEEVGARTENENWS